MVEDREGDGGKERRAREELRGAGCEGWRSSGASMLRGREGFALVRRWCECCIRLARLSYVVAGVVEGAVERAGEASYQPGRSGRLVCTITFAATWSSVASSSRTASRMARACQEAVSSSTVDALLAREASLVKASLGKGSLGAGKDVVEAARGGGSSARRGLFTTRVDLGRERGFHCGRVRRRASANGDGACLVRCLLAREERHWVRLSTLLTAASSVKARCCLSSGGRMSSSRTA